MFVEMTGSRMTVELGTELSNVSVGKLTLTGGGVGVGVGAPAKTTLLLISKDAVVASVILFQLV